MYIYDEIVEEVFYSSKCFDYYFKDSVIPGCGNARIGVFDIETTGLDPRNGQVIIGGLITVVDGGLRVRQFFAEDDGEEFELLEKYMAALYEADVLVSYNGNGFDFSYLKYRLKRHGLDPDFSRFMSLDMYVVLNKFSNLRESIPNLKQKTVEEYMGLHTSRDDEIDGGQSVQLYFRYLIDRSESLRDIMLLHNRDDILQLMRILWIFDQLDIHKIAGTIGFLVVSDRRKVIITGIKLKSKRLDINGRYRGVTGTYQLFRDDCTVNLEPEHEKNLIDPESDYGEIKINVPRWERDDEIEFPVIRKNCEYDHKTINIFAKDLVRDIMEKV